MRCGPSQLRKPQGAPYTIGGKFMVPHTLPEV